MKLYAKVKTERSQKGQGGNEYLDVDLLIEKSNKERVSAAKIRMIYNEHLDIYSLSIDPSNNIINADESICWIVKQ